MVAVAERSPTNQKRRICRASGGSASVPRSALCCERSSLVAFAGAFGAGDGVAEGGDQGARARGSQRAWILRQDARPRRSSAMARARVRASSLCKQQRWRTRTQRRRMRPPPPPLGPPQLDPPPQLGPPAQLARERRSSSRERRRRSSSSRRSPRPAVRQSGARKRRRRRLRQCR